MSTQLGYGKNDYASNGLARPRAAGMTAGERELSGCLTSKSLCPPTYMWQTFILLNEFRGGSDTRSDAITYARFDAPHRPVPSPWLLAQWREDFGWHRSLEECAGFQPQLATQQGLRGAMDIQVEQQTSTANSQHQTLANVARSLSSGQANLSQILAEAAHDIRSPIAAAQQIIVSLSQRLRQRGQLDAREAEMLHEAQMRLMQANHWAEGILIEQSLAHGQPVNVRRRFYPQQWLEGVQPLLNSLAIQRGVSLAWLGWDRSLPRLYLDANHLSRAVVNLVGNAIQASPPGSEVRVQVNWQTHVTQRLVITIDDQGRGLSGELMQQINASTVWSSERPDAPAAGLGLRTAKKLVRALGGTISAQRTPIGGTQFCLMLPVDNYHSLVHSWLQQNAEELAQPGAWPNYRFTIHALRSSATEDANSSLERHRHSVDANAPRTPPTEIAKSKWRFIDARLQQASSGRDLVYRVAADRWLWLSLLPVASTDFVPQALSAALRSLRERDNAWNQSLDCRQQQVFQWEPTVAKDRQVHESGRAQLMKVTAMLAEKIAELMADHVPPLDELLTSDAPCVIRPRTGGPARLIRSDRAHTSRPAALAANSPSGSTPTTETIAPSLTDTPCESFSGTLAELTQQWHSRQLQLNYINAALSVARHA